MEFDRLVPSEDMLSCSSVSSCEEPSASSSPQPEEANVPSDSTALPGILSMSNVWWTSGHVMLGASGVGNVLCNVCGCGHHTGHRYAIRRCMVLVSMGT